ncbi:MAG: glycosyltransferase family 4 protein [Planctomycetaceae bacterium]|nr:glycosyltransferase family 4 protein [Planctomycetaceae bacterium]
MVLHVRVITGNGGGPEKTIVNSPRFLEDWGYSSICAYLHPPMDAAFETLRQRANEARATIAEIDDRGIFDLKTPYKLLQLCRQHRVKIWHGHDYKSNAIGILLRRFWPMQLVTTVHGWVKHTRRTPLYYNIDRWCLKHYDRVLCVSEDLESECLNLGVVPNKCRLIKNGIDVSQYARSRSDESHSNSGNLVLGAMGRLSQEKGFDILIRAVKQLVDAGQPVQLLIAGDGDEKSSLARLIQELQLDSHVKLLGHVANPKAFFQKLDMFVLSSLREGLPNVLLEAMAMSVPVVATRIAGVPKLISHGENGLLVAPDSAEALESAMLDLVQEPALRARLGVSGRRTVEEDFNFATRIEKVVEIYNELLETSQTRSI